MSTPGGQTVEQFATMLHDLSQPMTTIRCLLDLAEMETEIEPIRQEIADALRECERMVALVSGMRDTLATQIEGERRRSSDYLGKSGPQGCIV